MDTGLETRSGGFSFPIALGLSLVIHAVALSLPTPPHHHPEVERPPLHAELRPATPLPAVKPEVVPPPPPPPHREPPPKPSQPRRLAVPTPSAAPPVAAPEPSPPQERREPAPAAPSTPTPPPAAAPAREPAPLVQPGFSAAYLSNPKPPYPLSARRRGETGTVFLKVLVTREGLPGTVELDRSSGSEALDRSALETVKHWRFTPANRGGEPVEAWVRVPIDFRLEGQ